VKAIGALEDRLEGWPAAPFLQRARAASVRKSREKTTEGPECYNGIKDRGATRQLHPRKGRITGNGIKEFGTSILNEGVMSHTHQVTGNYSETNIRQQLLSKGFANKHVSTATREYNIEEQGVLWDPWRGIISRPSLWAESVSRESGLS
jgi:hypothetical protein